MHTIALFGEAERGAYRTAYFLNSLEQLERCAGNPPQNSRGLIYGVQALLYRCSLLFFRVQEEGFSVEDYLFGLQLLQEQQPAPHITALCIPGVGNHHIIEASVPLCKRHRAILIMNEPDLYDFLLHRN